MVYLCEGLKAPLYIDYLRIGLVDIVMPCGIVTAQLVLAVSRHCCSESRRRMRLGNGDGPWPLMNTDGLIMFPDYSETSAHTPTEAPPESKCLASISKPTVAVVATNSCRLFRRPSAPSS